MSLKIFNTLSQTKESFEPLTPGKVGIYLCGPTVYKPSHIGHAVGPIIFDTIKRYLAFKGYEVTLVVNITDDVEAGLMPVKHMLALYVGGMGAKKRNFHKELVTRMGFGAEADRVQELYMAGKKAEAAQAVPDQLADEISLVGPEGRIRERISVWRETPVTSLLVSARTPAELETMARLVMG